MDERDVSEILALFEQELQEKLQEQNGEVERVKFYEEFNMNGIDFAEIFITTEKDAKGNTTYHIYCGDASNEILTIDSKGKLQVKNHALEKYFSEADFDLEKIMEENEQTAGKLKGISEKADPEEMKKALKGEKSTDEQQEEQDKETQAVEQDLEEQGEDLRISKYRGIKDSHIHERMPQVFKDGQESGIAFSNKLNRFVIISKVDGHYQMNENVEPAKMTWKTIISISPEGEQVERKVPHALMKLPDNQEKEIAVTLDEYGTPSIETVDVLPCQERIARAVREENEDSSQEETLEIRRDFETEGKEYKHDIAHQVQEIEDAQRDTNQTVDYDITPDDYIPNTEMTWGELMESTGESLPMLIERYNREMTGKNPEESENVVDTIETDYGNVQHEHRR